MHNYRYVLTILLFIRFKMCTLFFFLSVKRLIFIITVVTHKILMGKNISKYVKNLRRIL